MQRPDCDTRNACRFYEAALELVAIACIYPDAAKTAADWLADDPSKEAQLMAATLRSLATMDCD